MSFSEKDFPDLLRLAEEAAKLAGDELALSRESWRVVTADLVHDTKLAADTEAEGVILDFLGKRSALPILSEESGTQMEIGREPIWLVDPLDGTINYSRGIPFCCVSIGLWKDNLPALGAVYDFNRSELFSGIVGLGASLNGSPIEVSATSSPTKAVLCTGFPAGSEFSDGALRRFTSHIAQFRKVRLLGSAALSLAYVAAGRADAYEERDIMIWDVAAGLALVKAAGGRVFFRAAGRENTLCVSGSNGLLSGTHNSR